MPGTPDRTPGELRCVIHARCHRLLNREELGTTGYRGHDEVYSAVCAVAQYCYRPPVEATFEEFSDLVYESALGQEFKKQRKQTLRDRQQFNKTIRSAWEFAEETYEPDWTPPERLTADKLAALRALLPPAREAGISADARTVLVSIIETCIRTGCAAVDATARSVADRTGLNRNKSAAALSELEEAAERQHVPLTVEWVVGRDRRRKHRRWSPVTTWLTAEAAYSTSITVTSNPVDSPVVIREKLDICMSHYVLGEEFSVKALAEASGAKPDTVRRYLKKRASGVCDVYCIKARPDGSGKAKPDRWFKTESYEERVAKAAPRFAAAAASYEASLAGESKCNFPVGLGKDEHPCGDIAPVGQRYCPTHEKAIAVYATRKHRLAAQMGIEPDSVSVLDLMVEWDRQRGGPPVGAGRSSWSYYGDKPDPFDGVPPDN